MTFIFPVTPLDYYELIRQGFDHGLIGFGLVQVVQQDGQTHYAIQDGGWWSHPGLRPYLGRRIGINLNLERRQLEVTDWPKFQIVLAVLHRGEWEQ